jgi:small subunit ribosomal protein S11
MVKKRKLSFLKKNKKKIPNGIIHIHSTFNNTLITITDLNGNTLVWASSGSLGFRGTRKKTPYAAQLAIEKILFETQIFNLRKVEISIKGEGAGRETALRSIEKTNLEITGIRDITPATYNGCRPPKRRRA